MITDILNTIPYVLLDTGIQPRFTYNTSPDINALLLGLDTDKNLTNSKDVEIENRRHIDKLRSNEFYFLQILQKSDFEDGNSNEAIEYVEKQLKINSIATSNWISELFSKYSTVEKDDVNSLNILYGLLRIIAFLNNEDCFDYIKGPMVLILKLALSSEVLYLQEAALMVIESWRNKESLSLLEEFNPSAKYLKSYAETLKKELNEEVCDCISE